MATLTSQRQICASAAVAHRRPARTIGILNRGGERDHDVSILIAVGGDGLYCGVEPRLKVSMMFMRPPQHGHGWLAWSVARGLSGGCGWRLVCTGTTAAGVRAAGHGVRHNDHHGSTIRPRHCRDADGGIVVHSTETKGHSEAVERWDNDRNGARSERK